MIIHRLSSDIDMKSYLKNLGVDSGGIEILSKKSELFIIRIDELHVGAANILKQDALSVGADLAVPRGTVLAKTPTVNTLLIATRRQLEKLSKKELAQPFGLKELAHRLADLLKSHSPKSVDVMGIVNANDDSFYSGSRFKSAQAVEHIESMIAHGASIIDLGGVSSRYGSQKIEPSIELERVREIIDAIYSERLYERAIFSIDSYEPLVVHYALEHGFKWVNDISSLSEAEVAKLSASYGATVVLMHMQGTPQTMQDNPYYDSVIDEVEGFLKEKIEYAKSFGIRDIILDCGIGFGKRLEDNIELINHQKHFLSLGHRLLVGASRKSMIGAIDGSGISDRLGGTLAIHQKAIENGASIIRVHDVAEHVQMIKVLNALKAHNV